MIRTSYLVLFIVLISIGVGTASAFITITLSGNVIVTGDLDVEGKITGQTIDEIEKKFNLIDKPPIVDAGPDLNVLLGSDGVPLDGAVTDEGLPSGMIQALWTKQSGPGRIVFDNSSNEDTEVFFENLGVYVLRLSASDGKQSTFDEMNLTVLELPMVTEVSVPQGTSVPGCETTNECFIPYEVGVNVGDEVTWSNDDSAAHTVTAGSAADGPSGVFDSSLFMAGTTFSHTFEASGEFPYFCMVHPWMEGVVTVLDTGVENPITEFDPPVVLGP